MTDTTPRAPVSTLDILRPFAAAALRHALTVGAGALMAHGAVSSSGAEELVGAGMTIGGIAWSWYEKRGRAQLAQALSDAQAILRAKADAARAARYPQPQTPTKGA